MAEDVPFLPFRSSLQASAPEKTKKESVALLDGAPRPEEPIWKGDLEDARNGIIILGTPVGSQAFVQRFLANRLDVQTRLWERLRQVPDLQSAWLLLLYCAVPRANHLLRSVPPDMVAEYARAHDDGIWETFLDLIGYDQRHAHHEQLPLDRAFYGKGSGKGSGNSRNIQEDRHVGRSAEN